MQTKMVFSSSKIALLCVLFLPFVVMAEDKVTTLKDVMQGLNTNLQEATYGIIMDDYDLIAASAQAIADHPTPDPAILKKVVAHLGAEMAKFKGFDQQVHDTALELKQAAMAQDKAALLKHHSQIISGCVSCHQNYRESVAALLKN